MTLEGTFLTERALFMLPIQYHIPSVLHSILDPTPSPLEIRFSPVWTPRPVSIACAHTLGDNLLTLRPTVSVGFNPSINCLVFSIQFDRPTPVLFGEPHFGTCRSDIMFDGDRLRRLVLHLPSALQSTIMRVGGDPWVEGSLLCSLALVPRAGVGLITFPTPNEWNLNLLCHFSEPHVAAIRKWAAGSHLPILDILHD